MAASALSAAALLLRRCSTAAALLPLLRRPGSGPVGRRWSACFLLLRVCVCVWLSLELDATSLPELSATR